MSRFQTSACSADSGFAWQRKSTSRSRTILARSYLASAYSSKRTNAAASPFFTCAENGTLPSPQ